MSSLTMFIILGVVGAYVGAVADRFSYWFHVSRAMLWRKHCPKCFTFQGWSTYLPIFGFVVRRGVCIMCKQQLPIAPLVAECAGALALIYSYGAVFGFTAVPISLGWINAALIVVAVGGMLVLSISDLVYDEVPFAAYLVTLGALLARLLFFSDLTTFVFSVFAGILGGFFMSLLVIVSRWRWVHAHDILFGILIGIIVGWQTLFITFALAYLFAILGGLLQWGWGVRTFKGASSYGLYLFVALGAQAALQLVALAV